MTTHFYHDLVGILGRSGGSEFYIYSLDKEIHEQSNANQLPEG